MDRLFPCAICEQLVKETATVCPHCDAYLGPLSDLVDLAPGEQPMTAIYGAPPWELMEPEILNIEIDPQNEHAEEIKKMLIIYLQNCDMSVFYEGVVYQIEIVVQEGRIQTAFSRKSNIAPAQIHTIRETLNSLMLPKIIFGKIFCAVRFSS